MGQPSVPGGLTLPAPGDSLCRFGLQVPSLFPPRGNLAPKESRGEFRVREEGRPGV